MNYVLSALILVLCGVMVNQNYLTWKQSKRFDVMYKAQFDMFANMIDENDKQWNAERQQLLDRIQAPSFDHLKQAEVRVIRAQKEEKKEPPIEYV